MLVFVNKAEKNGADRHRDRRYPAGHVSDAAIDNRHERLRDTRLKVESLRPLVIVERAEQGQLRGLEIAHECGPGLHILRVCDERLSHLYTSCGNRTTQSADARTTRPPYDSPPWASKIGVAGFHGGRPAMRDARGSTVAGMRRSAC
ncbi:protein of unknown function (plasmid) [Ralstonia solanacearum PSI07]|nr:protein of unknown function [Ralstonia solanacearum PSI07]